MAPNLRINAAAFISPQNHPILIQTFVKNDGDALKYHYMAHTSLDVIEERVAAAGKNADCYLGLLYAMDNVAVYGYITPLRVKIVLGLALSDFVVRDVEVIMIFKALHNAYAASMSNPFLKLDMTADNSDPALYTLVGKTKWKGFQRRVEEVVTAVSNPIS